MEEGTEKQDWQLEAKSIRGVAALIVLGFVSVELAHKWLFEK